jgi:hypothetical protein
MCDYMCSLSMQTERKSVVKVNINRKLNPLQYYMVFFKLPGTLPAKTLSSTLTSSFHNPGQWLKQFRHETLLIKAQARESILPYKHLNVMLAKDLNQIVKTPIYWIHLIWSDASI